MSNTPSQGDTPGSSDWIRFRNPNSEYVNAFEGNRNELYENKAFAFPSQQRHNISNLDRSNLQKLESKIVRGFMRSIVFGGDVAANFGFKDRSNLRLNFQFNPEYIERRVSQSPGAMNPLLQDPAALTQAVPGTAQFNFTMMFNREAEVANYDEKENGAGLLGVGDDIESAYKDPGRVGVMHDLSIFDKIIGQGISTELIDIITAYTQQQNVAYANSEDEDIKKKALTEESIETALIGRGEGFLYQNLGNSAFINPMPVRIVFSDLFMVEGLVVSSAVAFQKFSQNMIPTICQVNCEVYALYFGFAQKKAFLSNSLEDWAKDTANQAAQEKRQAGQVAQEFANNVLSVTLALNDVRGNKTVDVPKLNVPSNGSAASKILVTSGSTHLIPSSNYYDSSGNSNVVTAAQWVNAMRTKSSGGVAIRSGASNTSSNITESVKQSFYSDQPSEYAGILPVTIWLEYATTQKMLPTTMRLEMSEAAFVVSGGTKIPLEIVNTADSIKWKSFFRGDVNNYYMQNTTKVPATNPAATRPGVVTDQQQLFGTVVYLKVKQPFDSAKEVLSSTLSLTLQYKLKLSATVNVGGTPINVEKTSNLLSCSLGKTNDAVNILYYENNNLTVLASNTNVFSVTTGPGTPVIADRLEEKGKGKGKGN